MIITPLATKITSGVAHATFSQVGDCVVTPWHWSESWVICYLRKPKLLSLFTIHNPSNKKYAVSCYLRHLKNIIEGVGIEVTPTNRRQVDQVIHQIVVVAYKNCPETWKKLKQQLTGDEQNRQEFISQLKAAL